MCYSKDFRKKVFEIKKKEKLSVKGVANRFGISERSVYRWKYQSAPKKTRNKPATKIDMEALQKHIEKYPDAFLSERASDFKVSVSGIHQAIKRLNITYKKNTRSSKSRS